MHTPNGQCGGRIFSTAVLLAAVATAAQSMAADPREWRLLSRAQVNPPGVQAFVETFFSHNQLKADPEGDLVLGFTAVRAANKAKDTDVFMSRFVRSQDVWTQPAPVAETEELERSPAIRIDGKNGCAPRGLGRKQAAETGRTPK